MSRSYSMVKHDRFAQPDLMFLNSLAVTLASYLTLVQGKWRHALLVPEVVAGVHPALDLCESPKVCRTEIPLAPHLATLVARYSADHRVHANVEVPVVNVRGPRILAHERRHEVVQAPDPVRLRRSVAPRPFAVPVLHVLDVVEHAAPVRERGVVGGDVAHSSTVRLQDELPRRRVVGPEEDLLPRLVGEGFLDVVGLVLNEGTQGHGPVDGGVAEVYVRRELQPAHLLAVGVRHAELRESAAQRRHHRVALAEVQGFEGGLTIFYDNTYGEVVREHGRERLPFGHRVDGALVHGLGEFEEGHRRWDWHEPHLPRQHDAEIAAAPAADGPEEVVPHGLLVRQQIPVGVDHGGVENVVGGEAVLAHH
ncbi:hypothetical protein CFC21_072599 [Triticum aestivum]|uniref:Uncharacterized protein n=2 Tax=Triticum aestivum TaxID=4565 RepID=A0A9R1KUB9_WHEAT|nr:hypothetical protein CFC21_072599 [Triticum aestivum]